MWLLFILLASPAAAQEFARQAADVLARLEQVRLDEPFSFRVTDLRLEREGVRLTLSHGTLVFLEEVEGRVTGAVFEGRGEALVIPPSTIERKQLARFTGSPILTASFLSAYFRFTDNTFTEWLKQIRQGRGRLHSDPEVVKRWAKNLPTFNKAHSPRLLMDFLDTENPTYFFARVLNSRLGWFDMVVDGRRKESVIVGQTSTIGGSPHYNIWTSFSPDDHEPLRPPARGRRYETKTVIHPDTTLEGVCRVTLEVLEPGARLLRFQLSRFLTVEQVTQNGRQVEYFQNAGLRGDEAVNQGNDQVLVVLLSPLQAEEEITLEFHYQGNVITNMGNGVLFVGARGQWYPSLEDTRPAKFDMTFRYPAQFKLVAAGERTAFRAEEGWQEARWEAEVPVALAGFNIGDYESRKLETGHYQIEVFANRALEARLARIYRNAPESDDTETTENTGPAAPSALLDQVATDVADALEFFSEIFQPFPYSHLNVSQIPALFGQGYPGLIYLPTYTFLRDADQKRLGLNEATRRLYSQLMPAHETAHQWWGTWAPSPSYRDDWLSEALATYSGLLYFEKQRNNKELNRAWLDQFREDLLTPGADGALLDEVGALALGPRLRSSLHPNGNIELIYTKGPWVIHMLREVLRDPETGSDEIFLAGLRKLMDRPLGSPLSTAEFQRVFEESLPPYADAEENGKLDWFFLQWVQDTGIPLYELDWKSAPAPEDNSSTAAPGHLVGHRVDHLVTVRITQSEVPNLFTMPVPIFARFGEREELLGRVVVTGTETRVTFTTSRAPDQVLLDPHHTILRRTAPPCWPPCC